MAFLRFTSLVVLVAAFFLLRALRNSIAHAHDQDKGADNLVAAQLQQKYSYGIKVDCDKEEPRTSNPKVDCGKQLSDVRFNNAGMKNEEVRLLKATKEIVSLMQRDYGGFENPKTRPPINNGEPKD
ncbi:hypothetical protein Nepgr_006228 [Nepenthes gracilis]|uniref:Uncharacterized protein n=1 Tax=Nepenthes gracilis TaxID=150966 RepID=A0AAD3S510_NEPGR|nr:hypothetical protein Nepgr_006228 [Nepenthes gracilis]